MTKFRVAVVDDEYLVRQHIIKTMGWDALNLELQFDVESAEEALILARKRIPDILIADINMPGCTGIELTEQIHELDPDCTVIILTGFNDFTYLQGAIRAGVIEYLEKPLDKDSMERALRKAIVSLQRKRSRENYIHDLENRVERSLQLEREELARRLIFPHPGEGLPPFTELKQLGWHVGSRLALSLIRVDGEEGFHPSRGRRPEGTALYPVIRKIASRFSTLLTLLPSDDRPVLIGNPHHMGLALKEIRLIATEKFDRTISIGKGPEFLGIDSIAETYREASKALEESYFDSQPGGDYGPAATPRRFINCDDELRPLFHALKEGAKERSLSLLEVLFSHLLAENADRSSVDFAVLKLISFLDRMVASVERSLSRLTGRSERDWESHIACFERAQRLKLWLAYAIPRAIEASGGDGNGKKNRAIGKARTFIDLHYGCRDLNLQRLSDEAGVSPGYLSKQFKRIYGKSIIEYLCERRLQESKALLEAPEEITVYEVAERVGFSDPLYFSKVFKRHFGSSPRKYLKKKR